MVENQRVNTLRANSCLWTLRKKKNSEAKGQNISFSWKKKKKLYKGCVFKCVCKCVRKSFLCINCIISDRDHGIALQGSKEQAHTGSFPHFGLRQRAEKRRQISRVFIFILYLLCQKKMWTMNVKLLPTTT